MVRWLLHIAAVLVLASSAQAEAPSNAQAEASSSARQVDGEEAPSSAYGLPLRLSLLDPTGLAAIPSSYSCQDSPDEPLLLQPLIQLSAASLPLTRQLTLHSFSRWGCPRSAGAGAAVSYALELSPKLALVLAGGVAGFPHARKGGLVRSGVRADLQWATKDGQARSVGVDATQVLKSALMAGRQRQVGASISGSF